MPQTYRTAPSTVEASSHPLVVHCSDPRYQPHFQDFLRNSLGVDHYALLAVPGGAHCLVATQPPQKSSPVAWSWIEFLHEVAQADRVILIGHDGCRWYLSQRFAPSPAQLPARAAEDLRRVRDQLGERFPGVQVELYFARLSGDRATIEAL